jgi:hypothetical protein
VPVRRRIDHPRRFFRPTRHPKQPGVKSIADFGVPFNIAIDWKYIYTIDLGIDSCFETSAMVAGFITACNKSLQ